MEHETPPQEIYEEIINAAKKIWQDNYDDQFGYVTEKLDMINSIRNYSDDVMICYRMFDIHNQRKMRELLSEEALLYINNNR
jgi:hypothetical protein